MGLLAVAVGLLFCFRGYAMLRVVMAITGGWIGLQVGASLGSVTAGGVGPDSPASWAPAIVGAVLLAWLGYAFYSAGVLLFMGSIGYGLGTVAGLALGLSGWQLVLAAVSAAIVAVIVSLATSLPRLLLIVLTALLGAAAVLSGGLSLAGAGDPDLWTAASLASLIGQGWVFNLAFLGLAAAGIVVQSRRGSTGGGRTAYARSYQTAGQPSTR